MLSGQITGKIVNVEDKGLNESGTWKFLKFTIEVSDNGYTNYLTFEIGNKPNADRDNHGDFLKYKKVDQMVQVDYNIGGFTWEAKDGSGRKYANTLKAWKVFNVKEEEEEVSSGRFDDVEMGSNIEPIPF